ncbi:sensor histidine kinase [Streptomyces johnsoniae]|uniref:Histidine kinase n=1 Tax=Streptomyces johnsoniae TaxID=3075532 RepID=A0ABU2S7Y9_9ACTN|nr:histidine kinase [Streptomyces sp. DSM 41886]MDT0445104.1 histidine kinase [Streptomyces sp. DSM 41886]
MRTFRRLEGLRRTSQRARFHHYVAWSLYFISLTNAVLVATVLVRVADESDAAALAAVSTVVGGQLLLSLVLIRTALRYYLGGQDRPDRLLVAYYAATAATLIAPVLAEAAGGMPEEGRAIAIYQAVYCAGPAVLAWPLRRAAAVCAVPAATCAIGAVALDAPLLGGLVIGVATAGGAAVCGAAFRTSAWTLKVVDRLDAARETEARLAVAEERLRFGRDLHDVLGRNLSVIALKSELAAQLLQRDKGAALDEMAEVQRIARDSQREIREVVRGYRRADLHAELVGARGVLQAAGIVCRIEDRHGERLPEPVQSALGWVVREGTTNVLRHADAGRCTVRLRRLANGEAVLEMENDGVLAEGVQDSQGGGMGLAGLRERVAALGGSLSTERGAGGTFLLTARVPAGGAE